MLSYWEKQSLLHYDIVIIGSGIVGLSAALSIKEKKSSARVLVLERGLLPTGASTKNAGFACIGSLTEILDDLLHMSEADVLQLVEMRLTGLKKLRERLGDTNIDYSESGSYELLSEREEDSLNELEKINKLLSGVLKQNAFTLTDSAVTSFGFNSTYTKHLVKNNCEGQLHTGKMFRALIDLCLSKGIEIKTGCTVQQVEERTDGIRVIVDALSLQQQISFSAWQVAVCTNAFTQNLFPDYDVKPGRGQVLITKPVKGLKFKGIFHFDKGYYYFRELDGRVLFGGGRNLDFEKETSAEFEINETIYNDLVEKLRTIIIPQNEFEVDDRWAGIMAFGASKFPVIKRHSEHIVLGVRMGGMGVAIGSQAGEKLAHLLLNS